MEMRNIDSLDMKKWNRRIHNNYWIILFVSIFVSSLNLGVTELGKVEFLFQNILLPSVTIACILIVLELATILTKPQLNSYFIIFCGGAIAFSLISFHPTVRGIESILILPILASCIYFCKRKVIFSAGISIIFYLVGITCIPLLREETNIISMISIILFGGLIALNVMYRGMELLEHLKSSHKSSEDLIISKVMNEKLAKTDALTEVNNHRAFQEYIDHLFQQSAPPSLHLAIVDIDNFKRVNDDYGHKTGDLILKQTANIMRNHITIDEFIARYGGEEFVILFIDKPFEEVRKRLDQIHQEIQSTTYPEINDQYITVSIGVHTYKEGTCKDEWFSAADQALYTAKNTGKNKILIYDELKEQQGGFAG